MCEAVEEVAQHHKRWSSDYLVDAKTGAVQPVNMNSTHEMEERLDACLLSDFA